jgi:prefoldin subunit 5
MLNKVYRDNGAIGALLDEYEKALQELKDIIRNLTSTQIIEIIDTETNDESCRSIQTILAHTVQSGYTYVVEIRRWLGEDVEYKSCKHFEKAEEFIEALDLMFKYNEKLFSDYPNVSIEEFNNDKKIKVRWGQSYDVEQLYEHAIVHILRHRRQIERFIQKLKS